MRKFYAKLCQRGNVVVTYMVKNGTLEVTFEQSIYGGFKTLVFDINGNILMNDGYNNAEITYYRDFLSKNRTVIEEGAALDA